MPLAFPFSCFYKHLCDTETIVWGLMSIWSFSSLSSFGKTVEWFWDIISSFTQEELTRLLQFTTGSSQLPTEGFSQLKPTFQIMSVPAHGNLPTAHTWYVTVRNMLYNRRHVNNAFFTCRQCTMNSLSFCYPLQLARTLCVSSPTDCTSMLEGTLSWVLGATVLVPWSWGKVPPVIDAVAVNIKRSRNITRCYS